MNMISTMGKLRMVKAMTGRAMPRIRLLKAMYICANKLDDKKEDVPEGVVLASKTGEEVERGEPQEQQPGAVTHLQSSRGWILHAILFVNNAMQ